MVEVPSIFTRQEVIHEGEGRYVLAGERDRTVVIAVDPRFDIHHITDWVCISKPMPPPGWRVRYVVDRKYFFCERINVA